MRLMCRAIKLQKLTKRHCLQKEYEWFYLLKIEHNRLCTTVSIYMYSHLEVKPTTSNMC